MSWAEPPDDPADEPIAAALRSVPMPAPPPGLDRRVRRIIGRRRAVRAVLAVAPVVVLAVALVVWRPWAVSPVTPVPQPVAAREIPAEDLAVLFAPPPVDGLTVLATRNDVSVAALGRLEGVK
jgi:hypothetical protein